MTVSAITSLPVTAMLRKKSHDALPIPFVGMKVFEGADGVTDLVFRTAPGSYHVFAEVEAKQAARECGVSDADGSRHTNDMWTNLWEGS
jgi:hypothetical protein